MKKYRLTIVLLSLLSFSVLAGQPIQRMVNGEVYKIYNTKIDKIELGYIDEGRGDTILFFVHGLGSNKMAWIQNITELKKYYRCIAVDLPGYQDSPATEENYSLIDYAQLLSAFMGRFSGRKMLVGHSMGGQIAMWTGLRFPDHLDNIILIAPAGLEKFTSEEAIMMKNTYRSEFFASMNEAQIEASIKANFHQFPENAHFMIEDRMHLSTQPQYKRYAEIVAGQILAMLNEPVLGKIEEIKTPVLLVFGVQDMLIPNRFLHPGLTIYELATNAKDFLTDCHLVMIDNGGHMLQWEKSKEVNQAIMNYIRK
ncbi:MAG TPA: alpha/beta hydrolase [Saprospiraceae bacterium]|nr:alpha/beta hydrolase [Saprospiraceae bacterium]